MDNQDGMVTHLEPDMIECEVKWALGSNSTNKTSGGDRIPAELFQILKDDAVKVLHSYVSKFRKLTSGHRTRKGQFSFQYQERTMTKNVQATCYQDYAQNPSSQASAVCEPRTSRCTHWVSKRQRNSATHQKAHTPWSSWVYSRDARDANQSMWYTILTNWKIKTIW